MLSVTDRHPQKNYMRWLSSDLSERQPEFRGVDDFLAYSARIFRQIRGSGLDDTVSIETIEWDKFEDLGSDWGRQEDEEPSMTDHDERRDLISFSSPTFAPASILPTVGARDRGSELLIASELLTSLDPLEARILSLRLFGGLTLEEVSNRLDVSASSVRRSWRRTKEVLTANSGGALFAPLVQLEVVDAALLSKINSDSRLLQALPWRTFEVLIATVLEELGFEVELQQGTRDGGIDIIAMRREGPFGFHKYLVQAKRRAAKVGVQPVREILFLRDLYRATKACLATTSTFTRGAHALGEEYRWVLELRDFQGLERWIREAVELKT